MSSEPLQFPCARCGASRESLEAPCSKCDWAPASKYDDPPIPEITHTAPQSSSGRIIGVCSVLVVASVIAAAFLGKFRITVNSALPTVTTGGQQVVELFVVDSTPVLPGTNIDIIKGDRVLVSKVKVMQVRWKLPGPFQSPKYPASGFVGVSLSGAQWETVRDAGDISIRPSK